ncbi:MAG: YwiC-like family protein [Actinomycetia bacterium]|nr:YwiC-like family protein [Actinomycetes bacterium]
MAIPGEHGGWSLTAEPVLLGLLVAWSWPGLALGLGALVAFVARTPLKVILVDRQRNRWLERTTLAARIVSVEAVALVVLGLLATLGAGLETEFWLPLVLASPLIVLELWYDMRSRSRRLIPELAGTIGIGSVAAAIALAGGSTRLVGLGLWCIVAARSLAAVAYVRAQIQRTRPEPGPTWPSDAAQLMAVVIVVVGWLTDAVPAAAAFVIGLLAIIHLSGLRTPPRRAALIGIQQMVLGLAVVIVTAAAVTAS